LKIKEKLKQALSLLLVAALVIGLASCTAPAEEATEAPEEQTATPQSAASEPQLPVIALMMAGDTAFYQELATQAAQHAQQAGYGLLSFFSSSAGQQETDFYTAMGKGVKAIILIPVDSDSLQAVVEQAEAMKIPIINALNPVNGVVNMLISPDFQLMGSLAAEQAAAINPDGARVLTLEEAGTAFISQMIHDGFMGRAEELGNITVVQSVIVENDVDAAREQTAAVLDVEGNINLICAQSEAIAQGALAAAEQGGHEVQIIVCGASEDAMAKVEEGEYAACIFMSPAQLAELAIGYAVKAAEGLEVPQYAGMQIEAVTPETVTQYRQSGRYADIIQPVPTPESAPTVTPSEGQDGQQETDMPEADQPGAGEPDETSAPEG